MYADISYFPPNVLENNYIFQKKVLLRRLTERNPGWWWAGKDHLNFHLCARPKQALTWLS